MGVHCRGRNPERIAGFKYRLAISGLALSFFVLSASPLQARSLEEVVALAVGTHPTVQAAEASRQSADDDLDAAEANYLPTLDLSITGGYQDVTNSTTRGRTTRPNNDDGHTSTFGYTQNSLILNQNLFSGFGTQAQVASADATVAERGFLVQDNSELIGLRAVQAYLDVLTAERVLQVAESNVFEHEIVLDSVKVRVETGGGTPVEVNQVENRLAQAKSRAVNGRLNLDRAQALYFEAVGEAPDGVETPVLPVAAIPVSVSDAVASARENSPAIRAASARVDAREADIATARAGLYPTLDLELAGNQEDNVDGTREPSRDVTLLLKLNYNLYRGGSDKARENSARKLHLEARHREAEIYRSLERSVREAYASLVRSREQHAIQQERLNASEQILASYEEQFDLGQRTLIETLDARSELSQTEEAVILADSQQMFAHYQLLAAMGLLNTTVR